MLLLQERRSLEAADDWQDVAVNPIRTVLIALRIAPDLFVAPGGADNCAWAPPDPAGGFDPYGHEHLQTR